MDNLMQQAAEQVVETLLNIAATLRIERPPEVVVSEQEMADLYLDILRTPVLQDVFKQQYGEEQWQLYQTDMERRLARLGAINVALSPQLQTDEVEEIQRIAREFAAGGRDGRV